MVHFCHTSDGVRLAYATSGAGPPLVKASNWMTHLEYDWASRVWSHWWRALSVVEIDAENRLSGQSIPCY
jgi:hypothetical protein